MSETYSPALFAVSDSLSPTVRSRASRRLCVMSLRSFTRASCDLRLFDVPVLRINSAQPAARSRSPSGLFLTAPTSQLVGPESWISEYILMLTAPCSRSRPVGFDGWSGEALERRSHLVAQQSKRARRQETRRRPR